MKQRYQADISGKNVGETTTTVKMPLKMKNVWINITKARGQHHREAIRHLIEREIRMHYNMPDPEPVQPTADLDD